MSIGGSWLQQSIPRLQRFLVQKWISRNCVWIFSSTPVCISIYCKLPFHVIYEDQTRCNALCVWKDLSNNAALIVRLVVGKRISKISIDSWYWTRKVSADSFRSTDFFEIGAENHLWFGPCYESVSSFQCSINFASRKFSQWVVRAQAMILKRVASPWADVSHAVAVFCLARQRPEDKGDDGFQCSEKHPWGWYHSGRGDVCRA